MGGKAAVSAYARIRTFDFVRIRGHALFDYVRSAYAERLYETALRALRERPAGRFAPRGCAHQGRMRAYDVLNSWYQ